MDTEEFLRRVIPSAGNYATMGFINASGGPMRHRSYPIGSSVGAMADAIAYWATQGVSVYHALASYTMAEQQTTKRGTAYTVAERKATNAHSMKALIADLDVLHANTKNPDKAYPDRAAALAWIKSFMQVSGIPRPNLVVDSGNGYHLYWTLETAMPVAQWQPLAEALKAALLANGFIGDVGCTTDAARVLRPPGTYNLKSGQAVPVHVVDALTLPDYANATLVLALQPWLSLKQQLVYAGTRGGQGNASVRNLGPRPKDLPPPDPSMAAAAGEREKPPYKFANVSKRCGQAKLTLEQHGADQTYDHWRKADLPLLAHCVDGDQYAHPISDGYSGYTQAETDRQYADAKDAVENRNVGPPLCDSYKHYRSKICESCPWAGKIKTPLVLGLDDPCFPGGWRQHDHVLERAVKTGWEKVIEGVFSNPHLVELVDGGHGLTVDYTLNTGRTFAMLVRDSDIEPGAKMVRPFALSGITCDRFQADALGVFFVAWITKLRKMGQVEEKVITRPFGWNMIGPVYAGLAIAGDLYNADGTVTRLAVKDKKMASIYRVAGTFAAWRNAAALFEGAGARPDLQALIACSFASPLIALTSDIRGMTLNFWSPGSGVGKSTAIKVGLSVWGEYASMQSMDDTANSVMALLSGPRVLVRYWDEFRYPRDKYPDFVRLIYTIPQGKERQRMQSDTSLRPVGEWECLLVMGSNRAWADVVIQHTDGTDSGLLRLLDVPMSKQQLPFDPTAGMIIKGMETNYGHAGRVYAAYVASHVDEVRAKLADTLKAVSQDLNLQQEERYYATTIATIIVGATIAKNLGLFDFDVGAIEQCLRDAVIAARATRSDRVAVTQSGKYDLGNLVASFVNAQSDARLKTETAASVGGKPVKIHLHPKFTNSIKVQIICTPGVVRLHCTEFEQWLGRQGLPYSQVLAQMQDDWPATRAGRFTLGGGTEYTSGQLKCVEVPRGDPTLEDLFIVVKP